MDKKSWRGQLCATCEEDNIYKVLSHNGASQVDVEFTMVEDTFTLKGEGINISGTCCVENEEFSAKGKGDYSSLTLLAIQMSGKAPNGHTATYEIKNGISRIATMSLNEALTSN